MLHKGNISNIHICPEDVVDCVIGGSPCQDLSVAGLRKGIKHESKGDGETTRSGLFMEQIRIIKEMRDVDKRAGRTGVDIRPRWAVWENVPGALSSGKPKGEDFRIVLEEFAKIADPTVTIPGPPRGGWQPAGCIVGDGFSVAWRIMDARYHGVPQRRRRIALVCDFAADGAPSVLFDEEGLRWDFETSQRAWKGIAPYFAGCAAGSDRPGLGSDRGVGAVGINGDVAATLDSNYFKGCGERQGVEREVVASRAVCQPIAFKEREGKTGGGKGILCDEDGSCFTLRAHQDQSVCHPTAFHLLQDPISGEVSPCLSGREQCSVGVVLDDQGGQQISVCEDGVSPTLRAQMHGHPPVVCGEANAHLFEPASMKEENWQEREQKNALRSGESKVGHVVVESAAPDVVFGIDQQGGKGNAAWAQDVMPSLLSDSHGTPHGVAYAVAESAVPDAVYPLEGNGQRASHHGDGWSEEQVGFTLNSVERHGVAYAIDGNVCDRASRQNGCGYSENVSPTLNVQDRHAVVYDARGNGDGETVQTLTGDHARSVSDYTPLVCSIDGRNCVLNEEISGTLQAKPTGGQSLNCVNPVCIEKTHYAEKSHGEYCDGAGTLKASGGSAGNGSETLVCEPASVYWDGGQVANTPTKKGMDQRMPDKGQFQCVLQPKHRKYIVRRLTPLECSRLQGMPDDWCDIPAQRNVTQEDLEHWRPILGEWAAINGKKPKSDAQIVKWLSSPVSESAQYQMYGNGIALPQWVWVCGRIIETYGEHKPTMASLFDGTGSFPLIWNSILGGAYTAWSSEVNPDAIRVSKYRMEERGW